MINLEEVHWYKDGDTNRYLKEHAEELVYPEKMDVGDLAAALTFCATVKNPFAEELINRAGDKHLKVKYQSSPYITMTMEAVEEAAEKFGIEIVW